MSRYDELMEELRQAKTEDEKKHISTKIMALKAFEDAYKYNSKEMDLLS